MSTEKAKSPMPLEDGDHILQKFYQLVSNHGSEIYLTQPGMPEGVVDYTFQEVYDQAVRMAAHIKKFAPKGSNIAVISKNCAHFIACELAIWMAECVTVALFPNLSAGTTRYILEHSDPKMVFIGKLDEPCWNEMKVAIPSSLEVVLFPLSPKSEGKKWEDILKSTEAICTSVAEAPKRAIDDDAIIVYTSGSTGQSKGVLHTFQSLTAPAKGLVNLHSITMKDRYLSYLPIAHVMDRFLAETVSLYSGVHVYFAEALSTFKEDLTRCRPTLFVSVPRLWLKFQSGIYSKLSPSTLQTLFAIPLLNSFIKKKLLTLLGLDCCRLACSGSAPIPAELLEWYRELGLELLEGYGMSENFCYSHSTPPGGAKFGFIGQPFPGVECKLSEEKEILVKSPGMMKEYYKEPAKTAEVITADGFLKTGDKGFIDEKGNLQIIGRVKDLFKTSKGKYVAPAPIENIVNNDEHVELSLVGGSGQVATMIIVQLAEHIRPKADDPEFKSKINVALEDLLRKVNDSVEEYERASFIVVAKDVWTIEKEFLTPTMKIKRENIEKNYQDKVEGWYSSKEKVIWED